MKLTGLSINNFVGAKLVNLKLKKTVTLFCGANGSGKTSVFEAVRMALTGNPERVDLKKDYGNLISFGEKSAVVEVSGENDGKPFTCYFTLPDGKGKHMDESEALECVLDAQRFAKMDKKERRKFLFKLMGVESTREEVCKRMTESGVSKKLVDELKPFLVSGFEAAMKQAEGRAREQKGIWKAITGEAYGDKKAATWKPERHIEKSIVGMEAMRDEKMKQLKETDAVLAANMTCLGKYLEQDRTREGLTGEIERLKARMEEFSDADDLDLSELEDKIDEESTEIERLRPIVTQEHVERVGLVHDFASFVREATIPDPEEEEQAASLISRYYAEFPEEGAEATQEQTERFSKLCADKNAHVEERRQLESKANAYQQAKTRMAQCQKELDAIGKSKGDVEKTQKTIDELKPKVMEMRKELESLRSDIDEEKRLNDAEVKAKEAHQAVQEYLHAAELLSPEGIQADLLEDALKPLNNTLCSTNIIADGLLNFTGCVQIKSDMSVVAKRAYTVDESASNGGAYSERSSFEDRDYSMLSESEQWRVDAIIAVAIARLSDIKMVMLDRFDVLDIKSRSQALEWLDTLTSAGPIDCALIFATLKKCPTKLPESMQAVWLESQVNSEEILQKAPETQEAPF